jgi:hypothetical protein
MPIIVELIGANDSITFHPDPSVNGWVYDNATLDAWYALPDTDPKVDKRPNAHGAYGLGQVFTREHRPVLVGQYYGPDALTSMQARNRLSSMFNDGKPITMRVTDDLGATSRTVWLLDLDAPFRYDFAHLPFDVSLVAPDPRRYGVIAAVATGLPSGSSGLVWNLGSAGSGLYFDWGTEGTLGQVEFTNAGIATTLPRIEVAGGGFAAGFRITEIETGRELTLERVINPGDTIVLDSRTQRATIGAGDITGSLTARRWFSIPGGATRRYQINPLGGVTGSPTMTLYAAPAFL